MDFARQPSRLSGRFPAARSWGMNGEGNRAMRVRVRDQASDAEVSMDDRGLVLNVKPGLLSPRAYVALVLALESLEQSCQYLQSAG